MNAVTQQERVGHTLLVPLTCVEDVLQALQHANNDSQVQAVVLHTISGALLLSLDDVVQLSALVMAVESCAKPVIMALQVPVTASVWELALACDGRVADRKARLTLPAASNGLLPLAGSVQRLVRRLGMLQALEMLGYSQTLGAAQAHSLQLVDMVTDGDVQAAAMSVASGLRGRKLRLRDEQVPSVDAESWAALSKEVLRKGRHRPAVVAVVDEIQYAANASFDDAVRKEQQAALLLRDGRDAQAQRYQRQAEQRTTVLPAELNVPPRAMQHIAVIGAGTMGTGIAISALDAGLNVQIFEQDQAALDRGVQRVQDFYDQRVAAGKLAADKAAARKAALTSTLDWAQLAQADVVIEAVFEDLAVKQNVFKTIDQHARPGALLATNTSYLDLDAIAQATSRPQDVIGLHFFSPANVMKLLEVVRLQGTAVDAIATGMALGKKLGKLPVLCGNAFGFIGNRIYNAYRKQVEFMLEDGALPEQVDAALQQFGFAMGPFAVADLSGLDIAWRMRKSQAATRDPKERYVSILDQLCEQGRLGRKTGTGYYTYADGKKSAVVDDTVKAVIEQASQARGLTRRRLTDAEIVRRTLMAMCNEAALLLAEGVARQPSDIDVALVQGYGFPRWEGGPMFWLSQFSAAEQAQMQQELAQHVGHGFAKGDLALLQLN